MNIVASFRRWLARRWERAFSFYLYQRGMASWSGFRGNCFDLVLGPDISIDCGIPVSGDAIDVGNGFVFAPQQGDDRLMLAVAQGSGADLSLCAAPVAGDVAIIRISGLTPAILESGLLASHDKLNALRVERSVDGRDGVALIQMERGSAFRIIIPLGAATTWITIELSNLGQLRVEEVLPSVTVDNPPL